MQKKKTLMAIAISGTVLTSCYTDTTPPPEVFQPRELEGAVHLGETVDGRSEIHTDADAEGKLIELRLNGLQNTIQPLNVLRSAEKPSAQKPTAQKLGAQGIVIDDASLLVKGQVQNKRFVMKLPAELTEAQKAALSPVKLDSVNDKFCTVNKSEITNTNAKVASTFFTMGLHDGQTSTGTANATSDQLTTAKFSYSTEDTSTTLSGVKFDLIYSTEATRLIQDVDCGNGTRTLNMMLDLEAGWNLVQQNETRTFDTTNIDGLSKLSYRIRNANPGTTLEIVSTH